MKMCRVVGFVFFLQNGGSCSPVIESFALGFCQRKIIFVEDFLVSVVIFGADNVAYSFAVIVKNETIAGFVFNVVITESVQHKFREYFIGIIPVAVQTHISYIFKIFFFVFSYA